MDGALDEAGQRRDGLAVEHWPRCRSTPSGCKAMTEPGEGMRTVTTALSDRIAACLRAGDEEIGGPGMALHDAGGGVSRLGR